MDEKTSEILTNFFKTLPYQMPKRMTNIKKLSMLWLFWHWGFLQGVFWESKVRIETVIVLRSEKDIWPVISDFFSIYWRGIKKLKITVKTKEFENFLEGINDDFLIVCCDDINNGNEIRARHNMEILKGMMRKTGDLNAVQKICPILLVEEMVPEISLSEEDYLLIDLKGDDFIEGGWWRAVGDLKKNEDYVEKAVSYIEVNYPVIQNQIEREKAGLYQEKRPHIRALNILSAVVAMIATQNNFEESFIKLRKSFWIVVDEFNQDWECAVENSDLIEIFRIQFKKYITCFPMKGAPRKHIPELKESYDFLYDEDFIYFKRELLENVCKGELREIPFVRILRQLRDEGFLKETGKKGKDLTSVVNIICEESGNSKRLRLVALRKNFFM